MNLQYSMIIKNYLKIFLQYVFIDKDWNFMP